MDHDISPPPVKRRKLLQQSSAEPSPSPRPGRDAGTPAKVGPDSMRYPSSIRIFSWNVNGVGPLLPAQSTKITSFFQPSGNRPGGSGSSARRTTPASPLRAFLSRHRWPEVLFLQELKIPGGDNNPASSRELSALLSALNTPLSGESIGDGDDTRTYTLHAALSRDWHNARGFGGRLYGVATALRADFAREHVSVVRGVDWDLEGRVSVVELRSPARPTASAEAGGTAGPSRPVGAGIHPGHQRPGSGPTTVKEDRPGGPPLALVNVYAVNGTSAPYRDPRDGRPAGTRHGHKRAFHARLRDECLRLEARGFRVVVAGDLNVARGPLDGFPRLRTSPRHHCANRADFNAKFFGEEDNRRAGAYTESRSAEDGGDDGTDGTDGTDGGGCDERQVVQGGKEEGDGRRAKETCLDAVDVFRAVYGAERRYTYYPRTREWGTSCDRVDMVLVSKSLWEAGRVVGTGILDTPQERGLSDHVPLWVEIAMGEPE